MIRDIRIAEYTYQLPAERIALYPCEPRHNAKLLVYRQGLMKQDVYRNFASYLPEGALVIFNDTRVVYSRLLFPKASGTVIEIFCLEPDARYADITTGMASKDEVYWRCLVGKNSRWKEGDLTLTFNGSDQLTASRAGTWQEGHLIHLRWTGNYSFAEVLQLAGAVPLPPYIKRKEEARDKETYQTLYAREEGSVAAPTAGLHFTQEVFDDLRNKGMDTAFVTLHVGAGTFKPVKSETIGGHEMHAEWLDVSVDLLIRLIQQLQQKRPVVAVGTTAMRTLESLYWMGALLRQNGDTQSALPEATQWTPYENQTSLSALESLQDLLAALKHRQQKNVVAKTQILIAPGYNFRIVDALATNFHQPNSTLLLLIAAFIGENWKRVYEHALQQDFRFLSYGDGSLLFRQ
ncbi:MAG: S-adenosylmethionine:tRNA ribosyltransferase-isomerase [Chitinophagales bacterium]